MRNGDRCWRSPETQPSPIPNPSRLWFAGLRGRPHPKRAALQRRSEDPRLSHKRDWTRFRLRLVYFCIDCWITYSPQHQRSLLSPFTPILQKVQSSQIQNRHPTKPIRTPGLQHCSDNRFRVRSPPNSTSQSALACQATNSFRKRPKGEIWPFAQASAYRQFHHLEDPAV